MIQYRLDGEDWKDFQGSFYFPAYGIHLLEIRVLDGVGYYTYIQQPVSIDGVTIWYWENQGQLPCQEPTMVDLQESEEPRLDFEWESNYQVPDPPTNPAPEEQY